MKNTITRQELKEIHNIVCQDWKTKLENYAKTDPFSETVSFTEKQIQEVIAACSSAGQTILVKKLFEVKDIWEDVKTIDDAINKLGEKDEEVIQLGKLQSLSGLSEAILNNQIAVVITKALNDGWVSNWNDSSEYKYFPWFYLGDNFRYFRYDGYYGWDSGSLTSARLCFKSSELAIYAGRQFTEVYKKFIN